MPFQNARASALPWVLLLLAFVPISCVPRATSPTSPTLSTGGLVAFAPPPGAYSNAQSITLTASLSGSTIYYTIDGTTPTATSPIYTNVIAIPYDTSVTIRAFAAKAGFEDGPVVVGTYSTGGTNLPAPDFSIPGGAYGIGVSVNLTDTVPGCTIYYTLDGSTPTTASASYLPITLTATTTVKAFAYKIGWVNSPVVTATYSIPYGVSIAGNSSGFANGVGVNAYFNAPQGIAVAANGVAYVVDNANHCVRVLSNTSVTTNGATVGTFAGSTTSGFVNATGTSSRFWFPSAVAIDGSGNLYVADYSNHVIRLISTAGVCSTFAGTGVAGLANGAVGVAQFFYPNGVAVDSANNVYVADSSNNCIRKISGGVVSTLAGSGTVGAANGTGAAASFYFPTGVAVDSSGNVFVADANNNLIRMITPAGVVTTYAGSGAASYANGVGTAAAFKYPFGIAIDSSGIVYVGDYSNHRVRKIFTDATVTNLAGGGNASLVDGAVEAVSFNNPAGVAVDSAGNVFVADRGNHRIRKIVPP